MSNSRPIHKNQLPILSAPADNHYSTLHPTLDAIFEAMEDGICVQSPEQRILRANSAFAAMLDLPMESIIGHTCAEVFGCEDRYGGKPQFCALEASSKSGHCEDEELAGRQLG